MGGFWLGFVAALVVFSVAIPLAYYQGVQYGYRERAERRDRRS